MDSYERRCRQLLGAYPAHYREERGGELLTTLLDTAEPGRTAPPPRESWNVIRGGLTTRWRTHPPPHQWVRYRFWDGALPPPWRGWARHDIQGRLYPLRRLTPTFFLWLPFIILGSTVMTLPGWEGWNMWTRVSLPLMIVIIAIVNVATRQGTRTRMLAKHDSDGDEESLSGRRRRAVRPERECGR